MSLNKSYKTTLKFANDQANYNRSSMADTHSDLLINYYQGKAEAFEGIARLMSNLLIDELPS